MSIKDEKNASVDSFDYVTDGKESAEENNAASGSAEFQEGEYPDSGEAAEVSSDIFSEDEFYEEEFIEFTDEKEDFETEDVETILSSDLFPIDDPVRMYLKDIGKIPLLSSEKEQKLAKRMAEGDEIAKNQIVESNLRLVVSIAKRYVGKGLYFLDLIQIFY